MDIRRINILGTYVDVGFDLSGVVKKLEELLRANKPSYVCTVNPEFILEAEKDREFQNIINNADLSVPDGSGVVMAEYYLNTLGSYSNKPGSKIIKGLLSGIDTVSQSFKRPSKLASKITGVSLSEAIMKLSAEKKYSIFLLGGSIRDWRGRMTNDPPVDVAKITAEKMRQKYPGVNIIGATSEFSYSEKDDKRTVDYIRTCMSHSGITKLDFVLVAYGQKKQERWIIRNSQNIPFNIGVGVGGTFDYLSGVSKKPSDNIVEYNLEWMFRLFTQPWRFGRIVRAFPVFPIKVFLKSLS